MKAHSLKFNAVLALCFLLIFIMYGFFSLSFVIGKATLNYASPFFLTAMRFLFAGIVLLIFSSAFGHNRFHCNKRMWWKIFLIALFNVFLTNGLEFWGLRYMSAFKTCFIYSMSPFIAALLSYLFLHEKMTRIKWVGISIGFIGFIPILFNTKESSLEAFSSISWPEIALIAAATATVIGWISMRSLLFTSDCSFLFANALSMIGGGILSLATSLIWEDWHPVQVIEWWPFIQGTLVIAIITNFISYNLYALLLKRFSATFMSFCGFSSPIMTALFGWIFLRERVSLVFLVAALFVFIGLFLFSKDELTLSKNTVAKSK